MIDVGGPSMLRAAAKNFAHVAPVCRPGRLRARARRAARVGRALARDAPRARGDGVRDHRGLRGGDRGLVRRPRGVPAGASCRCSRSSATSPTARTRTSARPTTRRAARATHLLSRVEQLHGRELSFNNLNDLNAARLRGARVHAAGVRDRQAREPVRRRGRRDDRGGVRRARSRPTRSRRTAASSSSTAPSARRSAS